MRLLDTDVLIDVVRGYRPVVEWIVSLTEPPLVPGIVQMELVQGCQNTMELRRIEALTAPYALVWPTEEDCRRVLAEFTQFRLGYNLGMNDALIAATAVGRGATLVTFNRKHFSVVPNLVTEPPYQRAWHTDTAEKIINSYFDRGYKGT